ncbi:hypothetical protein SLEP1_g4182 [Rubroshorea leprosula]|uniref:HTH La-type RNA-binding domain-containing protein n=1 Tax=Rubroshorea leprosula TaxID=152421 RepID=A0AAV5HMV5_9ROSI|nr:hypothetical protein SLEP1_g4182 [Rubroshorea leprosula]
MTADSSSNHHSPRDGVNTNSPQFRRKNLPCPWVQVVRREPESILNANHSPSSPSSPPAVNFMTEKNSDFSPSKEAAAAAATSVQQTALDNHVVADGSDLNSNNAGGRPKKPAWNKPSKGVVEVSPLGAMSWPALSESARASSRSSPDGSSRTVSDGSASTSQGPVNPHSAQRQAPANVNPNSIPNRTTAGMSGRQKNSRRGSGGGNNSGGGSVQGGFPHPPPPSPPPFLVLPLPPVSGFLPAMPDPSLQEPQYRPAGGLVSQPKMVNDHRPSRRGSYGRGDGAYQNSFGRRDQDRGNYGNTRDVHMQPHRGQNRGMVRPPGPPLPNAPSFVPQLVRPFGNPIGYPDFIYLRPTMPLEPFRGVPPYIAPPHPMVMHPSEPSLSAKLVYQIDYYFSDVNLVKDDFLKSNMDEQGWVPIFLIAGFPRVRSLTTNIQSILDALRGSTIVEVQGDKVRKRDDWIKWISSSSRVSSDSGSLSRAGTSAENLAAALDKITVGEHATNPHTEDSSRRHSSELTGQSQLSSGEGSEDMCSNKQ